MAKQFSRLLSIQRGEWLVTALMFLYIFSALTSYYILKPLRSGIFLTVFDARKLVYVYWLSALFAGTLATPVYKLGRRVSAIVLLTGTNVLFIATLFYFRWAIGRDTVVVPYLYYVYVQVLPVLVVAEFWLLAGYIYDSRQAKRIYGLLGAGASAGALAGSSVPGFLRQHLSTPALLDICIGLCAFLIFLSHVVWRHRRRESGGESGARRVEESRDRLSDLFRMVLGSRHLTLMSLVILLVMISSQLADWQIQDAAQNAFGKGHRSLYDEFFGKFNFYTNLIGFTLQLVATGFVVRKFGIGAAILFLPSSVFLSSFGVLLVPSLVTVVLVEGCDSVFRYSLNRVGLELLYMPLPREIRKKIKLFIDVFLDRCGRAIAGVIVFALTSRFLPLGLRGTSVAIIVLSAASLVLCFRLRRTYLEAFRQQLQRKEMDLATVETYVTDPASVRVLVDALGGGQERQILYALGLLQSVRGVDFSARLLPLVDHPSPHVRAAAVRALQALPGDHGARAERLLHDPDEMVRVAAVELLCAAGTGDGSRLHELLGHESIEVRLAAARCASDSGIRELRATPESVRRLLAIEGEQKNAARRVAARMAAQLDTAESLAILRELLKDPAPEVAAAAARSCGRSGRVELVPELVELLGDRRLRAAAREALVLVGEPVVPPLGAMLADPRRDTALRREIPWVLGRIATRSSADILVDRLEEDDPLLKYRVVKALNRLHEQKPVLLAARPEIAKHIYAQTRAYYEALVLWQAFVPGTGPNGSRLLVRALKERLDQNLELIFRLLGLQYPQKDIYFAYTALRGNRGERRGAAIEFLDNLLQKDLKAVILPLLEERSAERLIDRASTLFGIEAKSRGEALRLILEQSDAWLKACALHEVGERRVTELAGHCSRLAGDTDPIVRETAHWALRVLAGA